MTTIASRTFRSSPYRDAVTTWDEIVQMLARDQTTAAARELRAVTGIVASLITDQCSKSTPIIVTCDGPRTRIYCLYDEDALDEADANEEPLGYNALEGDWRVSLPCQKSELAWVQSALKKHSARITARDLESGISVDEAESTAKAASLVLDLGGFLK